ncbi:hypothetical protein O6072_08430 [Mycolicibacterium neoaurum]|uniref:hypothetical protein n=1 Tax=Mycolicibacterium neoaurum TaxID=1795 RepID=UPI00248C55C9|nr:hypothetical protein [Mycolicibacterium neoaurum]WBP96178.1 hypothetical protein O7W24_08435 [Mycolicibacterium neoaurum]WBS09863.1 hypothetical protein O6072_08430 [Mycolicibacterium neoaurum]
MATAGALVAAPVVTAPTALAASTQARHQAVELAAFENPFVVLQSALQATGNNLNTLGGNINTQWTTLGATLGTPAVQAELADTVRNVFNPGRTIGATIAAPGKYGPRILEGASDIGSAAFNALAALVVSRPSFDTAGRPILDPETGEQVIRPAVLPLVAGLLAQGKVVEAFGELNYWFLVDGLVHLRAASLDLLRIPGDFLDDLGLGTLGRILGTSWMTTVRPDGELDGPGLLSRGVIGNFGRAMLAPAVTATFQTVEIVQATMSAVMSGNLVDALSHLVNAPVKIMSAFVNGYVPGFLGGDDPIWEPGSGQTFPGLLSPQGTFDFFFAQLPQQIARALNFPRPEPLPEAAAVQETDPAAGLVLQTGLRSDAEGQSPESAEAATDPVAGEPVSGESTIVDEVTDSIEVVDEVTDVTDGDAADLTDADGGAQAGDLTDGLKDDEGSEDSKDDLKNELKDDLKNETDANDANESTDAKDSSESKGAKDSRESKGAKDSSDSDRGDTKSSGSGSDSGE